MIFEFVGLPGTGKTTAIRELHTQGIAKRVLLKNKLEILLWFFIGVCFHPIATFQGLRLVFLYKPDMFTFWNHFVVRYARIYKADFFNKQIWVVDEPPLQNIYSLICAGAEFSEGDLDFIYKHSFSVGVPVHFSLKEPVRLERIKARGRDVETELDEKRNQRLLHAEEFLFKKLSEKSNTLFVRGDMTNLRLKISHINAVAQQ